MGFAVAFASGNLGASPAGPATGPAPQASFASRSLHPSFDPRRHFYVVRCGPGTVSVAVDSRAGTRVAVDYARPRSGSFTVDARAIPGQEFRVRMIRGERTDAYRVRCLPSDFPAWSYQRLRRPAAGLFAVSIRASNTSRPWVILFDTGGTPRWWFSPPIKSLWAQVLPDGTLAWPRSFGDGYGVDPRSAFEIHSLSGALLRVVRTQGTITDGHEFQPLPNGDVLMVSYAPRSGVDLSAYGGPRRASVVLPEIQQIDPDGEVVWSWNSYRHISLAETGRWWRYVLANPHPGPGGPRTYDPTHINSVEPWGKSQLIISTRHTDAIYGIERSSGRVLWKLGGTRTEKSLRVIGDPNPRGKLFGGPHDVRISASGILSVHNNETHRADRTRVVFFKLDPAAGTATYRGQLRDPQVKRSHCCGSARALDGGGWLVSWGNSHLVTGFGVDRRIDFRLRLRASSFRAVPVPRGAVAPRELDRGLEEMEPRP